MLTVVSGCDDDGDNDELQTGDGVTTGQSAICSDESARWCCGSEPFENLMTTVRLEKKSTKGCLTVNGNNQIDKWDRQIIDFFQPVKQGSRSIHYIHRLVGLVIKASASRAED